MYLFIYLHLIHIHVYIIRLNSCTNKHAMSILNRIICDNDFIILLKTIKPAKIKL